jgi:hypothetical protein
MRIKHMLADSIAGGPWNIIPAYSLPKAGKAAAGDETRDAFARRLIHAPEKKPVSECAFLRAGKASS